MKAKLKDWLFLQNSFPSLLDIWPPELEQFKKMKKKIESDRDKSKEELIREDWEQIGRDFDKIIPR